MKCPDLHRKSCVIEWYWNSLIRLETDSLLYLNTKLNYFVCCQIYAYPSSFTIINVTFHIKSAINVHTFEANINVTTHIK